MKHLWLFVYLLSSLVTYDSVNDAGSSSGYLLRLKKKAKECSRKRSLAWSEVASRIFLGDATASSHSPTHWPNHETPPAANPQPYPLDGDLNHVQNLDLHESLEDIQSVTGGKGQTSGGCSLC